MTQTRTTVFRAYGKDRMSDSWTTYEARFRWQVEQWIAYRVFVMCEDTEDGPQPVIAEVSPSGRSRIEWLTSGGTWEPYTAWDGPEARYGQIERARTEQFQHFRVVLEDEPAVLVGIR
jgi:hypothetical protein